MMETIKSIAYVEGFLKALGAVMQDREMTNESPGRITTETQYAANRLRSVEAFVKGMDCMIEDAKNYEAQIAELKAIVKEKQQASERTEQIAKWIKGNAIPTGNPGEYVVTWKCSNCGGLSTEKTANCPGCGARMEASGDGHETIQD